MNTLRFLVLLFAGGAATSALACDYPPLISIPAGEDATMEELLTAQADVRTYMEAMEVYLTCVNDELAAAGDDAPAEYKSIMFSRHNAAVTEMESVAEDFNEEVQAYKEANPDAG